MAGSDVELDVVVVGGGPAGLSAALWLARYRRRVRVYDAGDPRNEPTWAVHGYPGLPEIEPVELRRRLRDQALGAGAEYVARTVTAVEGEKGAFRVVCAEGDVAWAKRVLLAYGRRDTIPDLLGLAEVYGSAAFHCPDCDGPSLAGARVGVLGYNRSGAALALYLLTWTRDLVLLAHGRARKLSPEVERLLRENGIRARTSPVKRLHVDGDRLLAAELEDGTREPLDGLFVHLGSEPACSIAADLHCELGPGGQIRTNAAQESSVPGIYAAGDIAGHPHLVISAAAQGVLAALSIHRSLLPHEFRL